MRPDSLTAAEARRAVLAAQGLASRRERRGVSSFAPVQRTIERLNLLQIDSVNVLARAHYLPVYSRLGPYDRTTLDAHAFGTRRRRLFEYWAHEASLLPLSFWPLLRWRMRRAADRRDIYKGLARFAEERRDYIQAILGEVRSRGPVTARELSEAGARTGPWWGWHDGKTALEYLFWSGAVTAAGRRGFERLYDIPERAIPAEVLATPEPRESDAIRTLLSLSARALGMGSEADLRDYFRLPVAESATALRERVEAGELLPVKVEGWRTAAYLHRDAAVPARAGATALLSPFDPLVWERGRTERLFNFRYRIEIYTPAHLRQFGYYVLPFLM
ncbi:MAG: crosslink repair DNA glycosylase YcaQ family protein, partial [Aestuariivirgaceae bacterium]